MGIHRLDRLPQRELAGGLTVFEARTFRARLRGLAGLDELPPRCALLIRRCRSVHTFGMRFPLDLVFLDRRDRPVELVENVRPQRLTACRHAGTVLEAGAGEGRAFFAVLTDHPL